MSPPSFGSPGGRPRHLSLDDLRIGWEQGVPRVGIGVDIHVDPIFERLKKRRGRGRGAVDSRGPACALRDSNPQPFDP
jgi:hypothetical protein